ncbi:hypothetical protein FA954_06425 [Thermoactinomyces vulgaris]|nr:hypothetical protein FA954_06425 [Thermoactinomyces vulgaris]
MQTSVTKHRTGYLLSWFGQILSKGMVGCYLRMLKLAS